MPLIIQHHWRNCIETILFASAICAYGLGPHKATSDAPLSLERGTVEAGGDSPSDFAPPNSPLPPKIPSGKQFSMFYEFRKCGEENQAFLANSNGLRAAREVGSNINFLHKTDKSLEINRPRGVNEEEAHESTFTRPWCRTRDGHFIPQHLFDFDTCAHCYLFEIKKKLRKQLTWGLTQEFHLSNGVRFPILVLTNSTDRTQSVAVNHWMEEVFAVVEDVKLRENWRGCCLAAAKCCEDMQRTSSSMLSSFCPRTWDGWQCWGDAAPGETLFEPCPPYSYIETTPKCTKKASKRCQDDGSWFRRNGSEWSDYSSCGQLDNIILRLKCHVWALVLSVVALVPALIIFSCYRQLRVHRITLHSHLFTSLLLEALCSISFRLLQLHGDDLMMKNPPWCVALGLVRKYARLTNYMWYLCEGVYLHRLLSSAFAEQRNLVIFYLIGWVFPVIPLGMYSLLRGLLRENSLCWSLPMDALEWIFQVPPLLAILVNLIFMIDIIRILWGKVRATHDCEPTQFRVAVRATMMVVPLFGLQYIVTIYRPTGGACIGLDAYHVINNIIDGSTGLIVAIIFCYSNSEVRILLRRSWRQFRDRGSVTHDPRGGERQRPFRLRSLSGPQKRSATTIVRFVNNNSSARPSSSENSCEEKEAKGKEEEEREMKDKEEEESVSLNQT